MSGNVNRKSIEHSTFCLRGSLNIFVLSSLLIFFSGFSFHVTEDDQVTGPKITASLKAILNLSLLNQNKKNMA